MQVITLKCGDPSKCSFVLQLVIKAVRNAKHAFVLAKRAYMTIISTMCLRNNNIIKSHFPQKQELLSGDE